MGAGLRQEQLGMLQAQYSRAECKTSSGRGEEQGGSDCPTSSIPSEEAKSREVMAVGGGGRVWRRNLQMRGLGQRMGSHVLM